MRNFARDIIVIGGSAGGFQPLRALLSELPADLGAAVAVTLHRSPHYVSELANLLERGSRIEVVEPSGGEPFERGHVYLAPQDVHMTVRDGHIELDRGPKQHHTRPAIDPLFRSAAEAYGPRVVGVLLSGNLSDGVNGLIAIKAAGGLSLVQDPAEAPFPSMPTNALVHDHVDLTFHATKLSRVLEGLARGDSLRAVAKASGGQLRGANRGLGARRG